MNKGDLVDYLVSQHGDTFESKAQADRALAAFIDGIKAGLAGGKVQLVGFGTFEVKSRKGRTGRNPHTGAPLKIPPSKAVSFRPGQALKDSVKKSGGKGKKKK